MYLVSHWSLLVAAQHHVHMALVTRSVGRPCSSLPGWFLADTLNRSSIIPPWIRNRTLHCLWKINLFFFPGQLPHVSSSPLAGRNNFKWATYSFVTNHFRKGHLILDHIIPLSVPQLHMRVSWVHSKQMPEHTPLHRHCRRLLESLALSRVTSAAR